MKKYYATLPSGEEVYVCTIKGTNTTAEIITYGAILRSLVIDGTDIVSGFDGIEPYLTNPACHGATIGRVANRISDSFFVMDGERYEVVKNNGENSLHGGFEFNHANWTFKSITDTSVALTYTSPDGASGFPGELTVTVTYSFIGDALVIDYKATPKSKTPIALTNHSYFNLDGFGGDVKKHVLKIASKNYTEVDRALIPTGNHPLVFETKYDFTEARVIDGGAYNENFSGYDNNFVIIPEEFKKFGDKTLGLAAVLENDNLRLLTYSDQPGLQVYTGNGLGAPSDPKFKGGIKAVKYGGICLETQTEPNCIKSGIGFYDAGEIYTHTCVYELERK